jgi:hypothetical protein
LRQLLLMLHLLQRACHPQLSLLLWVVLLLLAAAANNQQGPAAGSCGMWLPPLLAAAAHTHVTCCCCCCCCSCCCCVPPLLLACDPQAHPLKLLVVSWCMPSPVYSLGSKLVQLSHPPLRNCAVDRHRLAQVLLQQPAQQPAARSSLPAFLS